MNGPALQTQPTQSNPWSQIPKWFDLFLWLDLLQGPKDPPFAKETTFDGETKRFWQILFISAVLTGFSVLLSPSKSTESLSLTPEARYSIIGIAVFAILYSFGMSHIFGIKISIRQAFFTFAFLIVPWIPIFGFIFFIGGHYRPLSVILVVMSYLFPCYIVWSIAKGISVVSGCTKLRSFLSVSLLFVIIVGLAIYSLLCT